MTPDDLEALLAEGEGQHLEFKSSVRDPRYATKALAAFANTGGGVLVVGVDDRLWGAGDPLQAVVGVTDADQVVQALRRAAERTEPPLPVEVRHQVLGGKDLVVAEVPANGLAGPYVGPFGIEIRRGDRTYAMSQTQMRAALQMASPAPGASGQEEVLKVLSDMNEQLVRANSQIDVAVERAEKAETELADIRRTQADAKVAANTRHGTAMRAQENTRDAVEAGGRLRSQWKAILVSGVVGAVLGVGATGLADGLF